MRKQINSYNNINNKQQLGNLCYLFCSVTYFAKYDNYLLTSIAYFQRAAKTVQENVQGNEVLVYLCVWFYYSMVIGNVLCN